MIRLFSSLYLMLLGFGIAYVLFGFVTQLVFVRDWLDTDTAYDYIGAFHLLEQLYLSLPHDQFQQVVSSYPAVANVPLNLFAFNELSFNVEQLAMLESGQVFVADLDKQLLYYKLGDSNTVARFGPMNTIESLQLVESSYEYALLVVLAIAVFLWILNLQRKLNRLNVAATKLGEGDFEYRVSTLGKHAVGQLNTSFNQMAERINRLVNGHKSLTNAIAHELRTPVARIRFQLDMLYEETNNPQQKDYMQGISEDVNELSDLVDELLNFARFDREIPPMNIESNSLHESLINTIADRRFDSEVSLEYDASWFDEDETQQYVAFEPKHMDRALGNLITNAQKYAASKVLVSVIRTDESCSVIVDDDGEGIAPALRETIFEPFKRLDNSRTRATGGYGLGLAIVKQIALWHNGTVSIEQAPLGGARFIINWPLDNKPPVE